ncbi:MAG: ROK family protein [Pseudomonadota bacterium]
MTSKSAFAIAIDLGGTQLRAALFKNDTLLKRSALPTDVSGGPAGILHQIQTLVAQITDGIDKGDILGIGLSTAGPVDTIAGITLGIPTLPGWDNFPIRAELVQIFGMPVSIENDAIAATLGEWRHGAGRNIQNLVYMTVSTGIGGGVVVDDRLLHGRKGMAAHIGHMQIAQQGPQCGCGATGCFEAFASGTALAKRASDPSRLQQSNYLRTIAKDGVVDAIDVFKGAGAGDEICVSLVKEEARYLGQGITSLLHLFSPERVIIGGGISKNFEMLEPGIRAVIQAQAMEPFNDVAIVQSKLGDDSGLVGAATMVMDQHSI